MPFELAARLGAGGEGEVFAITDKLCAKVYHAGSSTAERREKLQAMLQARPAKAEEDGSLAWPEAILFEDAKATIFAGFVMPRVEVERAKPLSEYLSKMDASDREARMLESLEVGLHIAALVAAVHASGHRVGDLNDRNLLIDAKRRPILLDCDSFQVKSADGKTYYSRVAVAEYSPPEILNLELDKADIDRTEGDKFALATILFRLLVDGYRPYAARGSAVQDLKTPAEKTLKGAFPWETPAPGVLEPPRAAPAYSLVHEKVREGFHLTFVAGHSDPEIRIGADEWVTILTDVIAASSQSLTCEQGHGYPGHLGACPQCASREIPAAPLKSAKQNLHGASPDLRAQVSERVVERPKLTPAVDIPRDLKPERQESDRSPPPATSREKPSELETPGNIAPISQPAPAARPRHAAAGVRRRILIRATIMIATVAVLVGIWTIGLGHAPVGTHPIIWTAAILVLFVFFMWVLREPSGEGAATQALGPVQAKTPAGSEASTLGGRGYALRVKSWSAPKSSQARINSAAAQAAGVAFYDRVLIYSAKGKDIVQIEKLPEGGSGNEIWLDPMMMSALSVRRGDAVKIGPLQGEASRMGETEAQAQSHLPSNAPAPATSDVKTRAGEAKAIKRNLLVTRGLKRAAVEELMYITDRLDDVQLSALRVYLENHSKPSVSDREFAQVLTQLSAGTATRFRELLGIL